MVHDEHPHPRALRFFGAVGAALAAELVPQVLQVADAPGQRTNAKYGAGLNATDVGANVEWSRRSAVWGLPPMSAIAIPAVIHGSATVGASSSR